jgi:hypothetical protein
VAGGRKKDYVHVFVVIRVDEFEGDERITIKEVVTTREVAEREVDRLNQINGEKDCWYFWEQSRFFPDGSSFGAEAAQGNDTHDD